MVEFIITDIDALVIVLVWIISFISGLFPLSFVRPAATTFAHKLLSSGTLNPTIPYHAHKLQTNSLVRHISNITGYRNMTE